MKNILIFAGLAGIAAAIAIYFVSENLSEDEGGYITDSDIEDYTVAENTGYANAVL